MIGQVLGFLALLGVILLPLLTLTLVARAGQRHTGRHGTQR